MKTAIQGKHKTPKFGHKANRRYFTLLPAIFLVVSHLVHSQEVSPSEKKKDEDISVKEAKSAGLEVIMITAQKRAQSIVEVPIAVTAISGATLAEAKVDDLVDLQFISPNLSIRQELNPSEATFVIRGVGSAGTGGNFEQSVGVYIDGIYRGRPGGALSDLMAIERIEVLRGPQSTIFGRNNTAGAVSIVTQKPEDELSGSIELTAGTENLQQIRGTVTGPISEDVSYRVSFSSNKKDGAIDNLLGDSANNSDRKSIRSQVFAYLGDDTTLRVIADYAKAEEECCYGPFIFVEDSDVSFPGNPSTNTLPGVLLGANITNIGNGTAGTIGEDTSGVIEGTHLDPFKREVAVPQELQFFEDNANYGISAELNHDFEDISFTAIASSRMFEIKEAQRAFAPANTIPAWVSSDSAPGIDISENSIELRVANTNPDILDWIAGIYYFGQEIEEQNFQLKTPIFDNKFGPGAAFSAQSVYTAESMAVFGQFTYNINSDLDFTAGARYIEEEKTLDINSSGLLALPSELGSGVNKISDDAFMGSMSLSYTINPLSRLYGRIARGYKSGGISPLPFGIPVSELDFESETTDAVELGVKLRLLEGNLSFDAALFYQETNDLQVQAFDGLTFKTMNAAKTTSQGLEVEYAYAVNDNWTVSGGFTYLDAEYGSFKGAAPKVGLDDDSRQIQVTQDLTGEKPLQSPEWTITGVVEYWYSLNDSWDIKWRTDYRYVTNYTVDLQNNDLFANAETFQANMSINFLKNNSGLAIQFWGKNITNEDVILAGIEVPFGDSAYVTVNDPSSYGISLLYQF